MVKPPIIPSSVHAQPARAAGASAALAGVAALLAGCVEVVSLGSGDGDGGSGSTSTMLDAGIVLPFPEPDPIDGPDVKCAPTLETDLDGDGFTPMQGDCNDCDPNVGPDAVEMPTKGGLPADENCDGVIDEPAPVCDAGIAVDAPSAHAAARALDLCIDARRDTWGHERWGLVDATWVMPDGSPAPLTRAYGLGHGVLERFGPNVPAQHGARLLGLSTGTARQPTDPQYESPQGFDKRIACAPPQGFPVAPEACPGLVAGEARDGVALELVLRAPQNAEAIAFDFDFYTYELPGHACSRSDDLFVALLRSSAQGSMNIAFDALGNLVSVNTVQLEVCACESAPCFIGGRMHDCSLGSGALLGTGFGAGPGEIDHGATGWLTSTAPVTRGGTFTLRFSIHDSLNGGADSTVLLDHVHWLAREAVVPRSQHAD